MENNYWQDNTPIIATNEEKWKLLNYEIRMFYRTCKLLDGKKHCNQMESNLLIESLATHVRILIEFFYNDVDKRKYPNDLVAQDLLLDTINWREIRPAKTNVLEEAKNKADKQLAHLSLWRIKIDRDKKKKWESGIIKKDMIKVIEKFKKASKLKNTY